MVESARASKRGGKQGGLTRKLTLNAVEMVEKAGVVQRRRIRRLPSRRPVGARGRTRRLHGLRARFLLQVDGVDDDEALGQHGAAQRRRWPRGLRAMATAALCSSRSSARERRIGTGKGGNELAESPGASRCEERARGGLEARRRRRVAPGWLGGIPPSSLGAREVEEDPPAPGGPGGLAGPAPPGRQVSFFRFLFNLSFLFLFIFVLVLIKQISNHFIKC